MNSVIFTSAAAARYLIPSAPFLLPDLYIDNSEGVEFEEGDIDINVSGQISEGSISLPGSVEFRSSFEISVEDTGEQSLAKEESDVLDQPANIEQNIGLPSFDMGHSRLPDVLSDVCHRTFRYATCKQVLHE